MVVDKYLRLVEEGPWDFRFCGFGYLKMFTTVIAEDNQAKVSMHVF